MTTDTTSAAGDRGADGRRFLWWGGVTGLAASLAFLATGVLNSGSAVAPADTVAEMPRFLADVADVEGVIVAYGLAGVALCLLYVPMSIALGDHLGRDALARVGTIAVVAGLAVLLPAYVLAVAGTVGLSNAADGAGPGVDGSLFAIAEFATLAGEILFAVGSLLSLGVGLILWGVSARRSGALTPWLATLTTVVGVLGLVWLVQPVDSPIVVILVLLNVLGSLVALVAISLALLRAGRTADA